MFPNFVQLRHANIILHNYAFHQKTIIHRIPSSSPKIKTNELLQICCSKSTHFSLWKVALPLAKLDKLNSLLSQYNIQNLGNTDLSHILHFLQKNVECIDLEENGDMNWSVV